jgi:hypothetical protein
MSENKLTTIDNIPPQLQQIATFMALSDKKISIRQVCKRLSLNYDSVRVQICEARKNGNDFNDLLNEHSLNWLKSKINEIDRQTYREAKKGTHLDRKLYYERIGELKESSKINIHNQSLTVIVSPPSDIPPDLLDVLPKEQGEMVLKDPDKK